MQKQMITTSKRRAEHPFADGNTQHKAAPFCFKPIYSYWQEYYIFLQIFTVSNWSIILNLGSFVKKLKSSFILQPV